MQTTIWDMANNQYQLKGPQFRRPNPDNFRRTLEQCTQISDPTVKGAAETAMDKLPQATTEQATLESQDVKSTDGKK